MSYIFESFKDWQKIISEDASSDKLKLRNTIDQKMVIKVINDRTFRVRAKWGGDVIDAVGNLTQNGWNRIMAEINNTIPEGGTRPLIDSMPALQDLKKNIAVYQVIKDTDSAKDPNPNIKKQSFEFSVVPRPAGSPTNIEFIHRDEVATLNQKAPEKSTDVATGEILNGPKKAGDTFGLNFSKGPVYFTNLTDPKLINLIDSLYFKVLADDSLSSNPQVASLLKGIKGELVAKTLGDNSKVLVSALNAGFSITTRYGDPETGVTQTLLDNMSNVKSKDASGTPLSEVEGFDSGAFLAGLKPVSNIKVPAGGFIKGKVVKDEEFKKFQRLLAVKFQKSLGSSKIYKNFAKFQVGGADGTYGPNTANLVGLLKSALSDPKWTGNADKNNVDQAFVDRINQEKVAESYIGLDGVSLLIEGIDMAAVQSYEGSVGTQNTVSKKEDAVVTPKDGKRYFIQGKDGYEYFVKNGVWHYKKNNGPLTLLVDEASIKTLMLDYPKAGGNYIKTGIKDGKNARMDNHLYALENGVWKVKLNGISDWQDVKDTTALNTAYGQGSQIKATSKLSIKEIDSLHRKIATQIASWFPGAFSEFKGTLNDNEDAAWAEFKKRWSTGGESVSAKLKKVSDAINSLPENDEKSRVKINHANLKGILSFKNSSSTLYQKFMGGTGDDTYVIKLRQSDGSNWKKSISTDF